MRLLLLSFYVVFSFGLNAQNFHQKYDIDGFMEIADYTEPKSTFKKFKAHLEFQGVLFDNRFREEFENELVNYSDAMNFYNRYKKLKKNRKLLGILPFPILYSGTYISTIAMNSLASLIILSPESSSQGLDAHIQALKVAGVTTALTLPFVITPSKTEIATFFDALLIYHNACKKQYDSNLVCQDFYEKYQIAEFFSSADLSDEKGAYKAFKAHLKKNNNVFNTSFTNDYKDAIGFTKRIPEFPSAVAYYRNFDFRGLLYGGSGDFINSLKAYHAQMGVISFKKSDSPWEQDSKGENP